MPAYHFQKNISDVLIVGGGHNALVCAFYLAARGLSVRILEKRGIIGGAAVTEEFYPGFKNSTASYTVSLLNPKVIRDLDLARHGLKIVERKLANFLPLENGDYFKLGGRNGKAEIARFSTHDAERMDEYSARLGTVADAMRYLALKTPPDLSRNWAMSAIEILRSGLASETLRLGRQGRKDALKLFTQSAAAFLNEYFESDALKAALGWDSIVGNYGSPYDDGSAYILLHHVFGEVNGKKGVWGHAIGGMGAITEAMAKAAREKGAEIHVNSPVEQILIKNGVAVGAVTEKGDQFYAPIVVSNLNPKLLYGQKVDPHYLPEEFRKRMENWRCGSGTFRMNVALSELPRFDCLPEPGDHHTSGILIGSSLPYMHKAYIDATHYGWSQDPVVEVVISSTLDDSLAPSGKHVASLFCQHVAPVLPNGDSWDDHRDEVADLMINKVTQYAPNFKDSIIARQALTPLDLERTFGLVGGDIFHGALGLGQLYFSRPMLGYAGYRSPIPGLYMCGSGTHPGGGVTGAPGHNAAHRIISDIRNPFNRWIRGLNL